MTTLIIHPSSIIQRKAAQDLAEQYLQSSINLNAPPTDLYILDGANCTSIGIDQVKEIKKQLQYQPYEARYQIGLILHSNLLTREAQNSLLKILEEPGEQTIWILTTPHEKKLLPTIISRAKKVYIKADLSDKPAAGQTDRQAVEPDKDKVKTKDKPAIDIQQFLEMPIEDKFLYIENLLKMEKENRGHLETFLRAILTKYRSQLISAIHSNTLEDIESANSAIRKINKSIHFISKNTNKRLTLENLILQLEDSIM